MTMIDHIASTFTGLAASHEHHLLAASIFGAVFLLGFAVIQTIEARRRIRTRAIAFNPVHMPAGGDAGDLALGFGSDVQSKLEQASELLYAIERGLAGKRDARISRVRSELVQAGFFRAASVLVFYLARFLLAFVFGLIPVATMGALKLSVTPLALIVLCLMGAMAGFITPGFYLTHRKQAVQRECRIGFPDFLDLLVVSSQAGVPPRAAIERISRDLAIPYPYLGANLFLTYLQLRAGLPLVDAIEGLGRRVSLQEIKSFGMLLKQTEELGTKLSDALRVYSTEMRARRMLHAEARAHALPVKLVLPLALFIFPVMLIVIFMPILIRIQQSFV
jgi:tight adherence protein C